MMEKYEVFNTIVDDNAKSYFVGPKTCLRRCHFVWEGREKSEGYNPTLYYDNYMTHYMTRDGHHMLVWTVNAYYPRTIHWSVEIYKK